MAAKNNKPVSNEAGKKVENKFSKAQLLAAEKFKDRRDIVNALLSEKEEYTVEAVEEKIEEYMKGQVK